MSSSLIPAWAKMFLFKFIYESIETAESIIGLDFIPVSISRPMLLKRGFSPLFLLIKEEYYVCIRWWPFGKSARFCLFYGRRFSMMALSWISFTAGSRISSTRSGSSSFLIRIESIFHYLKKNFHNFLVMTIIDIYFSQKS